MAFDSEDFKQPLLEAISKHASVFSQYGGDRLSNTLVTNLRLPCKALLDMSDRGHHGQQMARQMLVMLVARLSKGLQANRFGTGQLETSMQKQF